MGPDNEGTNGDKPDNEDANGDKPDNEVTNEDNPDNEGTNGDSPDNEDANGNDPDTPTTKTTESIQSKLKFADAKLTPIEAKDVNASAFRLFDKKFDQDLVKWRSDGIDPLNLDSRDPDEERDPHYLDTLDLDDSEEDIDLNKVDFSDSPGLQPGAPDEFIIGSGRYKVVEDIRGIPIEIIPREEWNAYPRPQDEEPLKLKVKYIHMEYYTRDEPCSTKEECLKAVREIQQSDMDKGLPDIAHNFLLGGDGNVYEGRGWFTKPEKSNEIEKYHGRYLQVAYIGDYREELQTDALMKGQFSLIKTGLGEGKIEEAWSFIIKDLDLTKEYN